MRQLSIVACGTVDVSRALAIDTQFVSRFTRLALPRWQADESFLKLLASFERLMPLARPSNLTAPKMALEVFKSCDGTIGSVRKITLQAVERVLKDGGERVTFEILQGACSLYKEPLGHGTAAELNNHAAIFPRDAGLVLGALGMGSGGAACSLVSSTGPGLLRLDQGSGPQLVRGDVASHCSGQWLQAGAGSLYDLLQSAGCSSSTCAPQRLSALAAAFRDLPSAQASFWAAVLPCLPKGRYAAPSAYALALGFIVDLPQARRQSHGCVSALWAPVRSISKRLSCFGGGASVAPLLCTAHIHLPVLRGSRRSKSVSMRCGGRRFSGTRCLWRWPIG